MNDILLTAIANARAAGETRGRIPLAADYAAQPGWDWAALWDATEALNISIGVLPAPDFGPTPVFDWHWYDKKEKPASNEEILARDLDAMTCAELQSQMSFLQGVAFAQDEVDCGLWATDEQQERAHTRLDELREVKARKGFIFSYEQPRSRKPGSRRLGDL